MTLYSLKFLLFFAIVFAGYFSPFITKKHQRQTLWLLLACYSFYGLISWKALPLLLGLTIVYYFLGIWLKNALNKKQFRLAFWIKVIGIWGGVGVLLYFKYLNFFIGTITAILHRAGVNVSWSTLQILLPVGLSFFTFKFISYIIEISREHLSPSDSFIEFAAYIAFFPTILSGPIDRPGKFLPQLKQTHTFDFVKAMDGCQQILWGIFTKKIIADNLSLFTGTVWSDLSYQSASSLFLAIFLTPIQLYADFDGYSNMAIGVGKILGFDVTKNFNHPFLARNIAEYWRRWHISLTSWITDYIFMPLNITFRNLGKMGTYFAIFINIVVLGLWHGANWTYALFGIYHSLLFFPLVLSGKFTKNKKLKENSLGLPYLKDFVSMAVTFVLVAVGQILFFAPDIQSILHFFSILFHSHWNLIESIHNVTIRPLFFSALLVAFDWVFRKKEFVLQMSPQVYTEKAFPLICLDVLILLAIAIYGNPVSSAFIYFQF